MQSEYIKNILQANVYDVAIETPIEKMKFLSKSFGNEIFVKREDLQPVYSFKLRGAYNKMCKLTAEERKRGVIAASAGNHAQGVALSAAKLGIKATIVMPCTTPEIKVRSVRERGADVILHGDTFDEASAFTSKMAEENNLVFIHPYDDPDVIAGQGTIGMEILRQFSQPIDAIFIPVGGGGLIAGVAAYVKYLRPEVKVVGVESEDSACLFAAFEKGKRVVLPQVGIFADGVAVAQIGKLTYTLAKQFVDEVITVTTDEICAAIKDLFDDTRSIAEPAGALGLAGLKKYIKMKNLKKQNLITIESGANVNFDRLRHIAERSEIGESKEAIFAVTIPECPGSFRKFCEAIGKLNITEFNYRYADKDEAHIFVGVNLPEEKDREKMMNALKQKGYPVIDMSANELAKLHIRYMVGGRTTHLGNEEIFRFEFPERPGALLNLLQKMGDRWNISMFHYRNHGAAFGRVFLGLQVPPHNIKEMKLFLKDLNYRYIKESDNPAYNLFLG